MANDCRFCARIAQRNTEDETDLTVAFPDAFPVSDGHTLVVPRRHVRDLFELSDQEYRAVWDLVARTQQRLRGQVSPDGFNVGVNVGEAAGQTVAHAHVHVIPRYSDDVPDPRGGVRWVKPSEAAYWDR